MDQEHKLSLTPCEDNSGSLLFNASSENESGYVSHTPSIQSGISLNNSGAYRAFTSYETGSKEREIRAQKLLKTTISVTPASDSGSSSTSSFLLTNQLSDENRANFQHVDGSSSFAGSEYLDFMYHLGERRNYSVVIRRIFRYLSPQDLNNMMHVSRAWKNTVQSCRESARKAKRYRLLIESTKENRGYGSPNCESQGKSTATRFKLNQIQNCPPEREFSKRRPASPPLSPGRYRFNLYQQEARKLSKGERLFSCPKCKCPSHVDATASESNNAHCINSTCLYVFCKLCNSKDHYPTPCNSIGTPSIKKISCVGPTRSKRNLRRLLL